MEPLIVRILVVAAVAVLGVVWRRRDGRLRVAHEPDLTPQELDALGLPDAPARALLLSSPSCVPCATVRSLLDDVGDDDFVWVSVDAGEHLDIARRHRVLRLPTLLVLDRRGHVVARATGVPDREALTAAIDLARAGRGARVA